MHVDVIERLVCPSCRSGEMELQIYDEEGSGVVANGVLVCRPCGAWYPIEERLLDLVLPGLADERGRARFFDRFGGKLGAAGLDPPRHVPASAGAYDAQIRQRRHFDEYAESASSYDDYMRMPFWRAVDRDLFGSWRGRMKPGDWVLDVGCANGRSLEPLRDLDLRLVGFDISPAMIRRLIERAKREGWDARASFFVADASHIPFRDGTFDAVTVYGVLHHLPDPGETLCEAGRVLREGGLYFGLENNTTLFRGLFDLLMRARPIWREEAGQDPLISSTTIREWARRAGLRVRTDTRVFLPPHLFNLLDDGKAFGLLRVSDALVKALPLLRGEGGLIVIEGEKAVRARIAH